MVISGLEKNANVNWPYDVYNHDYQHWLSMSKETLKRPEWIKNNSSKKQRKKSYLKITKSTYAIHFIKSKLNV